MRYRSGSQVTLRTPCIANSLKQRHEDWRLYPFDRSFSYFVRQRFLFLHFHLSLRIDLAKIAIALQCVLALTV